MSEESTSSVVSSIMFIILVIAAIFIPVLWIFVIIIVLGVTRDTGKPEKKVEVTTSKKYTTAGTNDTIKYSSTSNQNTASPVVTIKSIDNVNTKIIETGEKTEKEKTGLFVKLAIIFFVLGFCVLVCIKFYEGKV